MSSRLDLRTFRTLPTVQPKKLERNLVDWGYTVSQYGAPSLGLIEKLEIFLYVNTLADTNIAGGVCAPHTHDLVTLTVLKIGYGLIGGTNNKYMLVARMSKVLSIISPTQASLMVSRNASSPTSHWPVC